MTSVPLAELRPFEEVAAELGIPVRSLKRRAYRREFDHVRLGHRRYFTAEQLAAFVRANTVTSVRDRRRRRSAA